MSKRSRRRERARLKNKGQQKEVVLPKASKRSASIGAALEKKAKEKLIRTTLYFIILLLLIGLYMKMRSI